MSFRISLDGSYSSVWRRDLLILLEQEFHPLCFIPNTLDRSIEQIEEENKIRELIPYHLFVLTPRVIDPYTYHRITFEVGTGKHVIAYAINDCNLCPYSKQLPLEWESSMLRSVKAQMDDLIKYDNFTCLNRASQNDETIYASDPYPISIEFLSYYVTNLLKD